MSFLPILNSSILGVFLISVFLWKVELLLLVVFLLLVSITFFWFDLLNSNLHYEAAFWLFIISEIMAFGSLLLCCVWFDHNSYINLSSAIEIPFVGCFLLLGSSITITAFHHVMQWNYSWVLLLLTIFLGFGFVALQLHELNEVNINLFDTTFHASCFCTIGLHFSHVFLGVTAFVIIYILTVIKAGEYRCTLATWYWHFVDYVWLLVYTVVYVC
uniref:Cytochrome c oxidase subunit 3 n=1 Tax=Cephalochlamys namaquensis TaxID=406060 RepID=A0A8F7CDX4_9CEST|nr:cytochrome c oxidase subunit 3 [Cephalochlamys namaquensis]